jgi:hypothetical protein
VSTTATALRRLVRVPDRDAWRGWGLQAWAVACYETKRLRRGQHAWMRVAFCCTPLLGACAVAGIHLLRARQPFVDPLWIGADKLTAVGQLEQLAMTFRFFYLPFILFLASLDLFGNLFRLEITERTLHHLFLQPVRREVAVAGKHLAALLTLGGTIVLVWWAGLILTLLPFGWRAMAATLVTAEGVEAILAYPVIIVLGISAYGAVFLLLGLVMRMPFVAGASLWLWERLASVLPQTFKKLTVLHYLDSLMPLRVLPESPLAMVGTPAPWPVAVLALLAVTVAALGGATVMARRVELAYGND